jgi:hypothetical protein
MQAPWASRTQTTMMHVNMTFDPSLFILNNQDLFMTVGVVVAIGTFTLVATAVTIMLALRSER